MLVFAYSIPNMSLSSLNVVLMRAIFSSQLSKIKNALIVFLAIYPICRMDSSIWFLIESSVISSFPRVSDRPGVSNTMKSWFIVVKLYMETFAVMLPSPVPVGARY